MTKHVTKLMGSIVLVYLGLYTYRQAFTSSNPPIEFDEFSWPTRRFK